MIDFKVFIDFFTVVIAVSLFSVIVINAIGMSRSKARLKKKIDCIRNVVMRNEGGINKRVDENRELLQLLENQCPEILRKNPWVVGWVDSHDKYLMAISECVDVQVYSNVKNNDSKDSQ